MTLVYYDPDFLEHDTGEHPENAGRLLSVVEDLAVEADDFCCIRPVWQPLGPERLASVHGGDYTGKVRALCAAGGGHLDMDTIVSRRSYAAALMAAGAVCDAVERVVGGDQRRALCLVRPPGHHALANRAMGFCLLNNVSIGARKATGALELSRVLVVDWDVHHGNGTQAIFWDDPRVGYFSIHRWPFYPGSGTADETGGGPGLGTTRNLPVRFGISRTDYVDQFVSELGRFADQLKPELILISAGFDSHRLDPIGSLGLESEDFGPLTRAVLEVADRHAGGRVVSVLEGGYHPTALAESVGIHLDALRVGDDRIK
jgi:acetoin utilization deacetylase AcuC-like enzyme